jgi:UDP-4-amino-4,6-dideoxy-N-acetyl-beta-L-altrosamine N-acetyltransferase
MKDIELVGIEEADLEMIRSWRNSEEVSKYMYSNDLITEDQQWNWYQKIQSDKACHYWMIVYEGEKIGVASVNEINYTQENCSWTFYLKAQAVRGAGIGSKVEYHILKYVFEELKMHKLRGEIFEFNDKVIKLHERFGFRREGFFRDHAKKEGRFHNVIAIGLLRTEWLQIKDSLYKMVYGSNK